MQSWRQYRRLGQHVQQQLDRDRYEDGVVRDHHCGNPSCKADQTSSPDRAAEPDLEKGQETESSSSTAPRQLLADEKEEVEQQDHEPTALHPPENAEEIQEGVRQREGRLRPQLSLGRVSTRSAKSVGTRLGLALTGINVRDRTTREGGDRSQQVFVVDYQGPNDPENPHNVGDSKASAVCSGSRSYCAEKTDLCAQWSQAKRVWVTVVIAEIGFVVGFASSVDSPAIRKAAAEFGVSEVVESMATGRSTPPDPSI